MTYVVVLPYIVPEFMQRCLDGCRLSNVLLVDNTRTNRGVMRSHNLGVDFMRENDARWLVILSAAIRFGDAGGLDFVEELDRLDEYAVVNAAHVFGWHLIAFSRETVERAGRWDENFTPYGFDDNDYAIRIRKGHPEGLWRGGIEVDVSDTIMGHSIKIAGVRSDARAQLDYFETKWGALPGVPFDDYHDHPFDYEPHPVGYWPAPSKLSPVVDGARWDAPLSDQLSTLEVFNP